MADANVARFPAVAGADISVTVDNLLALLLAIETAEASLGLERATKIAAMIDAVATASKAAIKPADALKAWLDFEATKKVYNDQAAALDFWEKEAGQRLDRLARDYGDQVLAALENRLAQLKLQAAIAKGDVDQVKNVIVELETRRRHLQTLIHKREQKKSSGPKSGS
jgi:hypothetical protein